MSTLSIKHIYAVFLNNQGAKLRNILYEYDVSVCQLTGVQNTSCEHSGQPIAIANCV